MNQQRATPDSILRRDLTPRLETVYSAAIVLFLLYFGLSHIKLYLTPQVYWGLGLLPLIVTAPFVIGGTGLRSMLRQCWGLKSLRLLMAVWLVFVFGIFLSAAFNEWQGLYTIPKYVIIAALCAYLAWRPPSVQTVVFALQVLCLFSLVIMGVSLFFEIDALTVRAGRGPRFGWVLAPYGVLWKTGIYLVPVLVWEMLHRPRLDHWLWFTGACLLVRLDGSRSGSVIILLLMAVFFALALLRRENGFRTVLVRMFLAVMGLVVASGIAYLVYRNPSAAYLLLILAAAIMAAVFLCRSGYHPGQRLKPATLVVLTMLGVSALTMVYWEPIKSIKPSIMVGGLRSYSNEIRIRLIDAGFRSAVDNFPWGGGFQSTTVQPKRKSAQPQVVHLVYLQVLADTGVISLIGYMGIFIVPIWAWARRIRGEVESWSAFDETALPMGIIAVYLLNGMMHPISNELSEWAVVVVAFGMLVGTKQRIDENSNSPVNG